MLLQDWVQGQKVFFMGQEKSKQVHQPTDQVFLQQMELQGDRLLLQQPQFPKDKTRGLLLHVPDLYPILPKDQVCLCWVELQGDRLLLQ